jgi:sugar/nucleoside kinase (ribokinase family)
MTKHLVSVGDLFIDLVVDLALTQPILDPHDLTSSSNCFGPITEMIGGSALSLALHGMHFGFSRSSVIGKLGCRPDGRLDAAAEWLTAEAGREGVTLLTATTPAAPTGRAILLYTLDGRRVMISDRGANALFGPEDVTEGIRASIREASALHISGYALLQSTQRRAVEVILHEAKRSGVFVALDYVPHDLYRLLDVEQLILSLSAWIDCAMVELPLASRLSGSSEIPAILSWWGRRFSRVVLHLEPGRAVIREDDRDEHWLSTYEPGVPSRGQSAAVQASILAKMVSPLQAPRKS